MNQSIIDLNEKEFLRVGWKAITRGEFLQLRLAGPDKFVPAQAACQATFAADAAKSFGSLASGTVTITNRPAGYR